KGTTVLADAKQPATLTPWPAEGGTWIAGVPSCRCAVTLAAIGGVPSAIGCWAGGIPAPGVSLVEQALPCATSQAQSILAHSDKVVPLNAPPEAVPLRCPSS